MRNYAKLTLLAFLFLTATTATLFSQLDEKSKFGKASYYSDSFQGGKTTSGETYDKRKLTGAHKTLPLGTLVKVTRLDNNKSVTVRINDRGPFIKGRIIEVSSAAASKLDLIKDGVASVKIEIAGEGKAPANALASKGGETPKTYNDEGGRIDTDKSVEEEIKRSKARAAEAEADKTTAEKSGSSTSKTTAATKTATKKATPAKVKTEAPKGYTMPLRTDKQFSTYDLYKISLVRPEKKGFGVQIASMNNYESVMKQVAELEAKWFQNILISIEQGDDGSPVYKIILGYFDTRDKADSYKDDLKKNKKISGFVVDLEEK